MNPTPHPPDVALFFDDAYVRLLAPFHSEADARTETAAVRELLGLALSDRVLDLASGWGRHTRLLREAGHDVVGVDASTALLRRAVEDVGRARDGGPLLVAGGMRALPFADRAFHAAINLASPIGLYLTDPPAVAALAEARRVLRPGGRLLLEAMHRGDVEPDFAPRDAWTLPDGTAVRARRRWDAERGISHEVLRWEGPRGGGTKRHSLRVRTGDELAGLLTAAGFEPSAGYGDWTGEPFEPASPRWIGVAEKAGRSTVPAPDINLPVARADGVRHK